MEDKYKAQKKHLSSKKRLSVWVDPDKYESFKKKAAKNNTSVYRLINDYMDNYLRGK